MAKKKASESSHLKAVGPSIAAGVPRCGLCGKPENLTKTECCGNWICDDEHEYQLFSYDRNSCHRNHRRYTLCGSHHAEEHDGDWQTCAKCREAVETELYVYYGTNEYNFEVLSNPPHFEPTKCIACGTTISLGYEGYSVKGREYQCEACTSRQYGGMEGIDQLAIGNAAASLSMEELIEKEVDDVMWQLDQGHDVLPVEAIRKVQSVPPLFIEALIESLEDATAAVAAGEEPEGEAYFYALFLLTEFQEHSAWPAIFRAISLPGDGPFELFGDAVTECLCRVMAVFLADRVDELEQLILNQELNEYVRWQGCHTYILWVRDGKMTREQAVSHLRRLLRRGIAMRDEFLVTGLVCDLYEFADPDSTPELREAFDQELVDDSMIDWGSIENGFSDEANHFAQSLERCPPTGVPDTVSELSRWASFSQSDARDPDVGADWSSDLDPTPDFDRLSGLDDSTTIRNDSPKVGRNDPCPCGSRKKYKKCCGG